jgi:Fe/S biogenesis protein NfuA
MSVETETPILTISDVALEKIKAVLDTQEPRVNTIRVTSPFRGKYAMNLEPEGKPAPEDTVVSQDGVEVFIDPDSLPLVRGASLDYVETAAGAGFQFTNPNDFPGQRAKKEPPEGPEGDFWRQVQSVLDEEINPAVAGHGGYINLIDVQDRNIYIEMGGGCQGCGMANVTLKQGVERILRGHFPEIDEILDVTDHAGGHNPYYAPSTK